MVLWEAVYPVADLEYITDFFEILNNNGYFGARHQINILIQFPLSIIDTKIHPKIISSTKTSQLFQLCLKPIFFCKPVKLNKEMEHS